MWNKKDMTRVLYIGKSNKKFTKGKLYKYFGNIETSIITIYANKNKLISMGHFYYDYFHKNFKLLNEDDIKKLERKNKINKINKNGQR